MSTSFHWNDHYTLVQATIVLWFPQKPPNLSTWFSLWPPAVYSHWVSKWQVENVKTWLCSTHSPSTKKVQWYSITPKLKSKTLKISLHDLAATHTSSSILMPYFPFGPASLANYSNKSICFTVIGSLLFLNSLLNVPILLIPTHPSDICSNIPRETFSNLHDAVKSY